MRLSSFFWCPGALSVLEPSKKQLVEQSPVQHRCCFSDWNKYGLEQVCAHIMCLIVESSSLEVLVSVEVLVCAEVLSNSN